MSTQENHAPLVQYLRELLVRAEAGEVLYFVGAAGVATFRRDTVLVMAEVSQFDVLVGAAVSRAVGRLDPDSIKTGYTRVLDGLRISLQEVEQGVDVALDSSRSRQS
jgi:hypothetical protein